MAKIKNVAKRVAKASRETEIVVPNGQPAFSGVGGASINRTNKTPALDKLESATPLADRCITRACVVRDAIDNLISRLQSYQDPRSARDVNDFLEVTLRSSLETVASIIVSLNCPQAYFPPSPAEIKAKDEADI